MTSYGANVHEYLRAADMLAAEGIETVVVGLDLRSLVPLDDDSNCLQSQGVSG